MYCYNTPTTDVYTAIHNTPLSFKAAFGVSAIRDEETGRTSSTVDRPSRRCWWRDKGTTQGDAFELDREAREGVAKLRSQVVFPTTSTHSAQCRLTLSGISSSHRSICRDMICSCSISTCLLQSCCPRASRMCGHCACTARSSRSLRPYSSLTHQDKKVTCSMALSSS